MALLDVAPLATATLLLRISAVFALAFVATRALHARSAALRAAVWRAAFAAAVLVPVLSPSLPRFGWEVSSVTPLVALPVAAGRAMDEPTASLAAQAPMTVPVTATPSTPMPAVEAPATPPLAAAAPRRSSPGEWLLMAWALGAVVLLVRPARGLVRARRIVLEATPVVGGITVALPHGVRVLASTAPEAPFVWDVAPSVRRAAVVLAAQRGRGAERAVLLHEREHLLRRDGATLLAARVVAACAWPTPLAWLALRRLALETERACDDAVLRGGERATDYAAVLVELACEPRLPVASMASRVRLAERVEAILAPVAAASRTRAALTARGLAAIHVAALVCAVPLAALGPVDPEPVPRQQGPRQQVPQKSTSQEPAPASGTHEPIDASEAQRQALLARGLAALVAMQDSETGAWRGDVGFKLNRDWRVTNADVPYVGATALAVEALAVAGARRGEGPTGEALAAGVRYLIGVQTSDGHFYAHGTRMREHALALRALAQVALRDERDEDLWAPIERGIAYSIAAQNPAGGWRYVPRAPDGDLLETTQQLDALQVAHTAQAVMVHQRGRAGERMPLIQAAEPAWREAMRRGFEHALAHWIQDPADRDFGGFRFQLRPGARVALDSTAQGLLALAVTAQAYPDAWYPVFARFLELRGELDARGASAARHFLALEADLAATRALEVLARTGPPEGAPHRDRWRAAELERLTALERPTGGWACDVGPGDAYFTAAACLRLARPER